MTDIEKQLIKDAKVLLMSHGYKVIRITESMQDAMDDCEAKGGDGDCCGCSGSICVMH